MAMVANWDMLVATMLARISWLGCSRMEHAFRGQGAIGPRGSEVSIFGEIRRMALKQPRPSQEIA
jgi:hypothetical protein